MTEQTELPEAERQVLIERARDMTPAEVDARLLNLASFSRPTAEQRAEHRILAERQVQHTAGLAAMRAYSNGDMRLFDQAHHRPPNQPPGQLRQTGPVGRFTTQAHRVLDRLHARGLPARPPRWLTRLSAVPRALVTRSTRPATLPSGG